MARLEAPRHGGLDSWAGRLGGSTCARALSQLVTLLLLVLVLVLVLVLE